MTNDRNMGNIETANQSNLVSAHGIFNSYNLDKVLYKKVLWKDLIQAYRSLKRVNDITQVSDLDFWNTLIVISRGNIRFSFIVTCYAGVLEDEEEVTIYSEHCETFGSSYGKVRVNNNDLSVTVEPMDFVPDMSGYYYIFGKDNKEVLNAIDSSLEKFSGTEK